MSLFRVEKGWTTPETSRMDIPANTTVVDFCIGHDGETIFLLRRDGGILERRPGASSWREAYVVVADGDEANDANDEMMDYCSIAMANCQSSQAVQNPLLPNVLLCSRGDGAVDVLFSLSQTTICLLQRHYLFHSRREIGILWL